MVHAGGGSSDWVASAQVCSLQGLSGAESQGGQLDLGVPTERNPGGQNQGP